MTVVVTITFEFEDENDYEQFREVIREETYFESLVVNKKEVIEE